MLPTPIARWWCAEIGVVAPQTVPSDARRTWSRDDFDDNAVSRKGVSLAVVDRIWTVANHSTTMQDVYLYDLRYGRRQVGPLGSLQVQRLRSWLLLPSASGRGIPHVITLAIDRPIGTPQPPQAPTTPSGQDLSRTTISSGEPSGLALRDGLRRAKEVLTGPDVRDLLAVYGRPYFAVSTDRPEPATHKQVATCLPGDESRGERALQKLRAALWGTPSGQPTEAVISLLIRSGLLTYDDVRAVRHSRDCGHRPEDVDPTHYPR